MPETPQLPAKQVLKDEHPELREVATNVQAYSKSLVSDQRAQQFYAQVSLMARRDAKIAKCAPDSLLTAMMACVHLDLMPNTPEQLAYVIPYWNSRLNKQEAQFQIGYKGLLQLMYRSGQVRSVNAELVFQGDEFHVDLGTHRQLSHRPNFDVDRTDYTKVTHAYVTVDLANGGTVFEVMTRKELDKIRDGAKASSTDAPWKTWPEQMAKKTVLKRALKLLPYSTDDNRLAYAAQFDSWAEAAKLGFVNGTVVERDGPSDEDLAERQRQRIKAAEAERQAMRENNFTPQVVQPFHEGDESQDMPDDPHEGDQTYAEVSYSTVKQQVTAAAEQEAAKPLTITDPETGEVFDAVPCDYPDCPNGQLPSLAEKCRKKYGKVFCQKHWGMANKGQIDPKGEWPKAEDVIDPDEVSAGIDKMKQDQGAPF